MIFLLVARYKQDFTNAVFFNRAVEQIIIKIINKQCLYLGLNYTKSIVLIGIWLCYMVGINVI